MKVRLEFEQDESSFDVVRYSVDVGSVTGVCEAVAAMIEATGVPLAIVIGSTIELYAFNDDDDAGAHIAKQLSLASAKQLRDALDERIRGSTRSSQPFDDLPN